MTTQNIATHGYGENWFWTKIASHRKACWETSWSPVEALYSFVERWKVLRTLSQLSVSNRKVDRKEIKLGRVRMRERESQISAMAVRIKLRKMGSIPIEANSLFSSFASHCHSGCLWFPLSQKVDLVAVKFPPSIIASCWLLGGVDQNK